MTRKGKVKELFNKYDNFTFDCMTGEDQRYNSKQCVLICIENEYRAKRELLFDLRSDRVIESEVVYLNRLDDTFNEEQELKQEIEKL